jgi:hypothetical protein
MTFNTINNNGLFLEKGALDPGQGSANQILARDRSSGTIRQEPPNLKPCNPVTRNPKTTSRNLLPLSLNPKPETTLNS